MFRSSFNTPARFITATLLLMASLAQAVHATNIPKNLSLPDLTIDTEWLSAHLSDTQLLLLDARPQADYARGHIKGAISLPVDSTFGPKPRVDLLAPLNIIQALFRKAGVDHNKAIVIYDNGEAIHAARLFWALEVYGLTNIAMLDGGLPAWLAANQKTTTTAHVPRPSHYVAQINPRSLTTKLRVRMNLRRPGKGLIDVRTAEEFQGETSKSKRYGHIPGAINVPWTENLKKVNGIQVLKSPSELKALYKPLIPLGSHTTAYCNKGKQSALTYLVLRRLGFPVSAYDGSWYEWGNDESLPIVSPSHKQQN